MQRTILTISVMATAALTAHRCVSPTGSLPAAGGNVLGVADSAAGIGDMCPVNHLGTSHAEASAAITKGALVETLDDGRIVTKTTGVAIGRALEAATGAGQIIEITLIPN